MRVQKGRERRGRSAVRRTELGVARSEQTNEFGYRNKRERRFQASYDATSVLDAVRPCYSFTGHYARSERPRTSVADRLCVGLTSKRTSSDSVTNVSADFRSSTTRQASLAAVRPCSRLQERDSFTGHYARSERPRTSRPIGCRSDRAYKSATRFTGHYARSERPRTSVAEKGRERRLCVGLSSA